MCDPYGQIVARRIEAAINDAAGSIVNPFQGSMPFNFYKCCRIVINLFSRLPECIAITRKY